HFDDFYKLLRNPANNRPPPATQRPFPRNGTAIEPRVCPVKISTVVADSLTGDPRANLEKWGIKTFGCVVGSGEG
ncbi:MAG TPA: hypothetical protein VFY65_04025, partial [Longimicrobium sp.]|nr:hypothetical protein [Longimicrobium sp.]